MNKFLLPMVCIWIASGLVSWATHTFRKSLPASKAMLVVSSYLPELAVMTRGRLAPRANGMKWTNTA
jgi:hypothetical protein